MNAQETALLDRRIAALPQEEKEATMPLTISWKEEGRAEGRLEATRRALLRIGEKRLGSPSTTTSQQISAIASLQRLERMGDRLLEVETWDDLLATV